jgi:hypothetical protein
MTGGDDLDIEDVTMGAVYLDLAVNCRSDLITRYRLPLGIPSKSPV